MTSQERLVSTFHVLVCSSRLAYSVQVLDLFFFALSLPKYSIRSLKSCGCGIKGKRGILRSRSSSSITDAAGVL